MPELFLKKPTFLIAGMQKAGTTTLAALLSSFPEIYLPPRKELHLFSNGIVKHRQFKQYLENFAAASQDQARGEASPIYSYLPKALEQAFEWLGGDIRVVLILRTPVARTYSQYWHEVKMGCEFLPFRQAIERYHRDRRDVFYHRHHSYIDRSLYSSQIARAEQLFGKERVLVVRLEDLIRNPSDTTNLVASFVAPGLVPRSEAGIVEQHRNPSRVPNWPWINHLFGRINNRIRRNFTPRKLLELNHTVGRYPPLAPADAQYTRALLLEKDSGLLELYPNM